MTAFSWKAAAHVQAATSGERLKAVAADFWQLLNSPSTWKDALNPIIPMKNLPLSVACLSALTQMPCRATGDFAPTIRHENVEATDYSVQRCFVFTSKPGVFYRIERSNNLSDWTTEDEIYGLGHEHVTAMCEQAAPPDPPPSGGGGMPTGSGPIHVTSIQIRPSSGTAGGTVVSWRSLDHGGAMTKLLPAEMNEEWDSMPLFASSHGNHFFFIGIPGLVAVAPPIEELVLGDRDDAMWEDLETYFPTMNQAVADSVASARLQPPPPPPDPDSRRFWRVFCDWSLDTDQDGSPDWMEFEIAARSPSAGGSSLRGDAFDADTNRNGIRDGEELDFDEDGVNDDLDAGKGDATATVAVGPVPRYALFPITSAQPPTEWPAPFQINDRGTVLYANGFWRAGAWATLLDEGNSLENATARAINDHDVILGHANHTDPAMVHGQFCIWGSAAEGIAPSGISTADAPVRIATFQNDTSGGPGYDVAYGLLAYGPVLSNEGRFCMGTSRWNGEAYEFSGYGVWTIPQSGQTAATWEEGTRGLRYTGPDGLRWGIRPHPNDPFMYGGGVVVSGGQSLDISFVPKNVAQLPESRLLAMPGDGQGVAMVHSGAGWEISPTFALSSDIAADGTAISRRATGQKASVLINGRWTEIPRFCPIDADPFDPPFAWHQESVSLLDTTPGGWILASKEELPADDHAALLPLRLEGYYQNADQSIATAAVGVDDFSIGSTSPGAAVKERIWIMAPQGGFNKIVKLNAPLNSDTPLTLAAPNILFGGQEEITVTAPLTAMTLRASDTVASGGERLMSLMLGTGESEVSSATKPVGLKIMKGRTVNVTVYKVTKLYGTSSEEPVDPGLMPTEEEITDYLNDLYRPQINVTFNVSLHEEPLSVQWEPAPGNGLFDVEVSGGTPGEEAAILNAAPSTGDSNIRVFIMGNMAPLGSGVDSYGMTDTTRAICWVLGSRFGKNDTKSFLLHTIAHEIGHIFVGVGHPDSLTANRGKAPLPGTKHSCRLMCLGMNSTEESRVLVKGEWDEAEEWLKNEESEGRLP